MRRSFQIALLIVAFLPFALGLLTLTQGAVRFLPAQDVTASLDNQLRFYSVLSLLPFLLAIWIVRNLEQAQPVLMIVLGATAFAGIARIVSISQHGMPEPGMISAIFIELGVLLFIPWYRRLMRQEPSTNVAGA